MIAKLTGVIDSISSNFVIVDVNGVGYMVFASNRTLSRIGEKGAPVSLIIETHVREDHIHLFGFADEAEKEWFSILTKVQGVGAKVGLAILSVCGPEKLPIVIAAGDKAAIQQADGVGPKLATRIVTELKDKVKDLAFGDEPLKVGTAASNTATIKPSSDIDDALSALVNLGYARAEAYTALSIVQQGIGENDNLSVSDLIKAGLKELTS